MKNFTRALAASTAFVLFWSGLCLAEPEAREAELKTAFIYNFAQFVKWPDDRAGSAFVIGVLGRGPVTYEIDSLQNERIHDRPVLVRHFDSIGEARGCDILFVGSSDAPPLPTILQTLDGNSILTIGETPRFTEAGGIIGFVVRHNKIRFVINQRSAEEKGLHINSQLLKLADQVIT